MSIDAMKQALEALEYCIGYKTSPFMTRECEAAITALRAAIEQAQPETELETYKRLYELRGKALERPCSNCGHQPAKIKTMAQQAQEPEKCHCDSPTWCKHYNKCNRKMLGLPPAPRQWQGLTDEEIRAAYGDDLKYQDGDYTRYARAIEAKLKEKNT